MNKKVFIACDSNNVNFVKKTTPIRKGDEVKILRGLKKGKSGKVMQCSRKGIFIYVDSITYKKKNGNESYLPIHPSNVEIKKLLLTKERKHKLGLQNKK